MDPYLEGGRAGTPESPLAATAWVPSQTPMVDGRAGAKTRSPFVSLILGYAGSVFGRACRFDQFSTVSPLKRAKSLSFVVAKTSPCTWAIAAI